MHFKLGWDFMTKKCVIMRLEVTKKYWIGNYDSDYLELKNYSGLKKTIVIAFFKFFQNSNVYKIKYIETI